MTIIKEDGGRLNTYAVEPIMYYDQTTKDELMSDNYESHNTKAERLNGRLAMLGFIAAIGAYALTGQIIPGVF